MIINVYKNFYFYLLNVFNNTIFFTITRNKILEIIKVFKIINIWVFLINLLITLKIIINKDHYQKALNYLPHK